MLVLFRSFFFSNRSGHTIYGRDWSSDVCSSDLIEGDDCDPPAAGSVLVAEPEQVKGLEFDHVYLLGLRSGAIAARHWEDSWIPDELLPLRMPPAGDELTRRRRAILAHVAMTRAREALVLSWPHRPGEGSAPSHLYRGVRERHEGDEEYHEEEL